VLDELKLFPSNSLKSTEILVAHFDKESMSYACMVATKLREEGVLCELYPDSVKIKKQFQYADRKRIPYVIVIGSEEIQTGKLVLKTLATGEQEKRTIIEIVEKVKKN